MKFLFPIQLIIYIFERRGKDESAGTCDYFSKATVKTPKVSSLQNLIFIETVFDRRELKHEDIYCRIRRSKWTVRAVSLSHEISGTTKAWVVKASKGSEFGAADHAGTATHLIKGLKKFGEGQSGWSIPSSWQEYSVQNRFLRTVQKYVESILHKKSDRVQKVIQGQRRRKGSNEMEVKCLAWVSQSLQAMRNELGAICWKGRRGVIRDTSESLSYGIFWGMGSFPHTIQSLWKITSEGARSPAVVDWSRDGWTSPKLHSSQTPEQQRQVNRSHILFFRVPPFTAQHFNMNSFLHATQ